MSYSNFIEEYTTINPITYWDNSTYITSSSNWSYHTTPRTSTISGGVYFNDESLGSYFKTSKKSYCKFFKLFVYKKGEAFKCELIKDYDAVPVRIGWIYECEANMIHNKISQIPKSIAEVRRNLAKCGIIILNVKKTCSGNLSRIDPAILKDTGGPSV